MDSQLSFLETEQKERNEADMVRILAINHNQTDPVQITESLTKNIPNSMVITAQYGIEGMKKAGAEQPDVILLDWNADETSCVEILKSLKSDRKTKHIPLIVLTKEHSDSATRSRALKMGASAFLGGPIAEDELIAQVQHLVPLFPKRTKLLQDITHLECGPAVLWTGGHGSRQGHCLNQPLDYLLSACHATPALPLVQQW